MSGGNKLPFSKSSSETILESASAALKNTLCGTTRGDETTNPRPIPGKTYELLLWRGIKVFPFNSTCGKGLPEAKRHLPSV